MDIPLTSVPPLPYKDRKAGLVIFGIFTILLGGIHLLLFGLSLAAPLMFRNMPNSAQPPDLQSVALTAGIYSFIGIANIWLGIGSIMARRWARALLLICSWIWLIGGVVTIIGMTILFPKIIAGITAQQPANSQLPPHFFEGVMMGIFIFLGVIFVILPLLWVIFYSGKNVKATCEALDPIPRWTDRCPLPVVAASCITFCGGLFMLFMPIAMHGTLAFFGTILSGILGSVCYILFALVWLYAGRSLYRLELPGWWLALAGLSLWTISQVLTFSHHSSLDFYALVSPYMLTQAQSSPFISSDFMIWCAVLWFIPFAAYLLYIRKFFPAKSV